MGTLSTNAFKEGWWRWSCWHTGSQRTCFPMITTVHLMSAFNGHFIHVQWNMYGVQEIMILCYVLYSCSLTAIRDLVPASLPISWHLSAIWAFCLKEIRRSIAFGVPPSIIYRQALVSRFLCWGLLSTILVPPTHLLLESRNAECHARIRRILSHNGLLLLEGRERERGRNGLRLR